MNGLVIAGGESTRMKTEKSRIVYRKKEIRYELYELLKTICNDVYISCNKSQVKDIEPAYQTLIDDSEFANCGPMSALLTAYKLSPDKTWFVIACDYPLFQLQQLKHIYTERNSNKLATLYIHSSHQIIEPLIGIYEPNFYPILLKYFKQGQQSIRKILEVSDVQLIPSEALFLQSIDTPEQSDMIKNILNQ